MFGDIVCSSRIVGRWKIKEDFVVSLEGIDIWHHELFHVVEGDFVPFTPHTLHYFVFPGISIVGKVSKVSEIYRMLHLVTKVGKGALKNVRKQIGSQIANVDMIINGRAAAVDGYFVVLEGGKRTLFLSD